MLTIFIRNTMLCICITYQIQLVKYVFVSWYSVLCMWNMHKRYIISYIIHLRLTGLYNMLVAC